MAANANFIERFGTVVVDGALQLNAQHVAAWGGIQSAGQIVGMLTGGFTSDRFGRKANMYILVSMLILVSTC
jgi:MFS family permease